MFLKSITAPNGYKCFPPNSEFHFLQVPMICIAGENGTGKTTILEMIESPYISKNFYNWRPHKLYFIDGLSISNQLKESNLNDVNKILIQIPQEIWNLTGIKFICTSNKIVFLKNNMELNFNDLSSGEQQLIAVFFMLNYLKNQNERIIFLLDEPDIHLNNVWRKKIAGLFKIFLNSNPNIQIIFTTHNLEVLSDINENEVYLCKSGEVENIDFNPFGMTKEMLEKKLYSNKYTVSDQVEKEFKKFDRRLKELEIKKNQNLYWGWDKKLRELREEIEEKFANSIIKSQLLEKIDNLRGR